VGDTIIITVALDPASGTVSCADSKGNAYTKDVDVTKGSGTSGVRSVIFSSPVKTALAGGNTITVTHPSLAARAMRADEFVGLLTSSYRDKTKTGTGTNATPSSGSTGNTTQARELVIGAVGVEISNQTFTPGAGFTLLASSSSATRGTTSDVTINVEYQ